MLKGIDQRLSAEIVHVLMLMGHGDDLVICDVNHPAATIAAETTYGKLIDMAGCDTRLDIRGTSGQGECRLCDIAFGFGQQSLAKILNFRTR